MKHPDGTPMKEIAAGVFEDSEGTPWVADPAKHSTEDLVKYARNPYHEGLRLRCPHRIENSRLLREIKSRGALELLA